MSMQVQDSFSDTTVLVATLHYIVADIHQDHPESAKIIMAAALELETLRKAGSLAEARSQFALPALKSVIAIPRAANGD
jgi:hypothetical protein